MTSRSSASAGSRRRTVIEDAGIRVPVYSGRGGAISICEI